jgi:hypothetical protein
VDESAPNYLWVIFHNCKLCGCSEDVPKLDMESTAQTGLKGTKVCASRAFSRKPSIQLKWFGHPLGSWRVEPVKLHLRVQFLLQTLKQNKNSYSKT